MDFGWNTMIFLLTLNCYQRLWCISIYNGKLCREYSIKLWKLNIGLPTNSENKASKTLRLLLGRRRLLSWGDWISIILGEGCIVRYGLRRYFPRKRFYFFVPKPYETQKTLFLINISLLLLSIHLFFLLSYHIGNWF